jgi:hypothetical protein
MCYFKKYLPECIFLQKYTHIVPCIVSTHSSWLIADHSILSVVQTHLRQRSYHWHWSPHYPPWWLILSLPSSCNIAQRKKVDNFFIYSLLFIIYRLVFLPAASCKNINGCMTRCIQHVSIEECLRQIYGILRQGLLFPPWLLADPGGVYWSVVHVHVYLL